MHHTLYIVGTPLGNAADWSPRAQQVLAAAPVIAAEDTRVTARLLAHRSGSDDFAVHGREVYWLRRAQQSDTNFSGARLERAMKMPATVRSITTVRKLAELAHV